jgi:hypothetical protein
MSTISLRLPDSLHQAARDEARRDHISINQLVATALAEKISALKTVDYLAKRALKAPSRKRFEEVMSKVPNRKPELKDRF